MPSRETARNIEAHSFVRESSSTEPTEEAVREFVSATGVDNFQRNDITRPSYAGCTLEVQMVSNVYDVATEVRVYSVESGTAHGQSNYSIITAEAAAIVGRMQHDKLIR